MSTAAAVVSETFARVVGPTARGRETTPEDTGSWSSLRHVQLVFEIEQALGIRLPEDLIVTRTTLGALMDAAEAAVQGS